MLSGNFSNEHVRTYHIPLFLFQLVLHLMSKKNENPHTNSHSLYIHVKYERKRRIHFCIHILLELAILLAIRHGTLVYFICIQKMLFASFRCWWCCSATFILLLNEWHCEKFQHSLVVWLHFVVWLPQWKWKWNKLTYIRKDIERIDK